MFGGMLARLLRTPNRRSQQAVAARGSLFEIAGPAEGALAEDTTGEAVEPVDAADDDARGCRRHRSGRAGQTKEAQAEAQEAVQAPADEPEHRPATNKKITEGGSLFDL